MSIFEYNKEEEEKKLRKAEYEAGIQKGVLNTARHLLELNLLSLGEYPKVCVNLQTDVR